MIRSLIVACARNGTIGRDNAMPWHLPADLAHFKRITLGHPVIMGRKTWMSIGRPLPGRRNLVVTRRPGYEAPGAEVFASLEKAWAAVADSHESFVIGGAQLYAAALPSCDRIFITEIDADIPGDTTFPHIDRSQWRESLMGQQAPDERNRFGLRFILLERAGLPAMR